jgi:hypothetical protein
MEQFSAPPRPAMTCHIGVTGHRALPGADPEALRAAAAHLFRAIRADMARRHAADQVSAAPLYRPDAPICRCICGLAAGADSLFATAALAEGWHLVAVLPFARDEFAKDFAAGPERDEFFRLLAQAQACELDGDRARGGEPYADIGQQIVEQSDILLAVWDGLPPRGVGGTGDVVHRALARGVPVAILPPTGPATPAWRGSAEAAVAALCPAPDAAGFPQAYFAETPRPPAWAGAAIRWFEHAVLAGWRPPPSPPAALPAPELEAAARLSPYFAPADRLATRYAASFRAAGLLRYGLVIPATLAAFVTSFGEEWMKPTGYVAQFVALVAVLAFSAKGGWERAQRRFIAYRALAEYFRAARLLAGFGAAPPPTGSADWTAWYARAAMRAEGLLHGRLDPAALHAATAYVAAETAGQIAYLRSRADRYEAIARRLKSIGFVLFACGVGFNLERAVLLYWGIGGAAFRWSDELALVLPAMAPVFLGLLGFGEHGRLATRYRAVAADLEGLQAQLRNAPPSRPALLAVVRRIADAMLSEGADWQLLVKARTLSAY